MTDTAPEVVTRYLWAADAKNAKACADCFVAGADRRRREVVPLRRQGPCASRSSGRLQAERAAG